ncbi:MAG TPA: hypothetical protein VNT54_03275 [Solirubrobacteraceae bacterium]|nr:hypothetical protein [Solirubrobacteraceae bacterium]
MHVMHPHPRRALVAAVAALALALLALLPAMLAAVSFSLPGREGGAQPSAPVSTPASARAEPAWQDNPFAWPLLQVPSAR